HILALTATNWALGSSNDEILVGGQAVIEGVMMRSPKGYSVAVRRQDGSVHVIKDVLKTVGEKWKLFKLPILRGIGVLGQALVLGIKALQFSAESAIADEDAKQAKPEQKNAPAAKPGKLFIAGNLVIALGMNI